MRLNDALHRRQTKALYPNHRPPPRPTEDATGDRSNRLLDVALAGLLHRRCATVVSRGLTGHSGTKVDPVIAGGIPHYATSKCVGMVVRDRQLLGCTASVPGANEFELILPKRLARRCGYCEASESKGSSEFHRHCANPHSCYTTSREMGA
jgi:hypothetical protein